MYIIIESKYEFVDMMYMKIVYSATKTIKVVNIKIELAPVKKELK